MSDLRRRFREAAKQRQDGDGRANGLSEQTPLLSFSNNQSSDAGSALTRPFQVIWHVLTSSYINIMLLFVPIGIAAGAAEWDATVVFVLNFLAIVPLASLLSFATEEVAAVVGQTIGGLLNATFGNAVELIISIIALVGGKIRLVQASMIGSILSNTLLILGCCFIAGGVRRNEQTFNERHALTMASLMAVSSTALIIPATLYAVIDGHSDHVLDKVEFLSRGTSIILLLLYGLYLYVQLRHPVILHNEAEEGDVEDEHGPQILRPWPAVAALIIITSTIGVCAEYLVNSVDSITEKGNLSETFIGLIMLPIVSNAAEHVTAVVVSYKDKMNLAIGVALGSGLQIPLLVTPILVLLGWIIGQPMTLRFEVFEVIVFLVTTMLVNNLIHDGRANFLEGAMCLGTYIIVALAFFVYPDNASDSMLARLFG